MTALVEFLLARLDEDERTARAATPGPWRWDVDGGSYDGEPDGDSDWGHSGPDLMSGDHTVITSTGYDADSVIVKRADAEYIARHDPARALAEAEAKRALLTLHSAAKGNHHAPWAPAHCVGCGYTGDMDEPRTLDISECDVVRHLAAIYADHPDYLIEWRPEVTA